MPDVGSDRIDLGTNAFEALPPGFRSYPSFIIRHLSLSPIEKDTSDPGVPDPARKLNLFVQVEDDVSQPLTARTVR